MALGTLELAVKPQRYGKPIRFDGMDIQEDMDGLGFTAQFQLCDIGDIRKTLKLPTGDRRYLRANFLGIFYNKDFGERPFVFEEEVEIDNFSLHEEIGFLSVAYRRDL